MTFTIALFVHLVSLVVGFGAVVVTDVFGLLWLMKRVPLSLTTRVADVTGRLVWIGWGGLVVSGIVLITQKGFVDNLMLIKLFFVAMLGVNGILLHKIKKQMQKAGGETLAPELRFQIGFASFVSQLGWWGAIAIGFIHNNWQSTIDWPPHPVYVILAIALMLVAAGFAGVRMAGRRTTDVV